MVHYRLLQAFTAHYLDRYVRKRQRVTLLYTGGAREGPPESCPYPVLGMWRLLERNEHNTTTQDSYHTVFRPLTQILVQKILGILNT